MARRKKEKKGGGAGLRCFHLGLYQLPNSISFPEPDDDNGKQEKEQLVPLDSSGKKLY